MTEDENNLNPQAASPTPASQQTQPSPVPPAPQAGRSRSAERLHALAGSAADFGL